MRRVYRRRSDMLVFMSLGLVIIAVVAVYSTTHGDQGGGAKGSAMTSEPPKRLVVLADDGPGRLTLERAVLADTMPHLLDALESAQADGTGEIVGPLVIDATWLQLANEYGAIPRVPLDVAFEGDDYRLQMMR